LSAASALRSLQNAQEEQKFVVFHILITYIL
jgi:hypothetical protein